MVDQAPEREVESGEQWSVATNAKSYLDDLPPFEVFLLNESS